MQRNRPPGRAHRPGGNHLESASPTSSAGWKSARQATILGQVGAALPQGQCGAQGHRRMRIVPAGVHDAVTSRPVGDRLGVVDPQGVDICPEGDHRLAIGIRRPGNEASSGRCDRAGDVCLFELFGEEPGGLILLAARFGTGVQPAADLTQQVPPRLHRLVNRRAEPTMAKAASRLRDSSRTASILPVAAAIQEAGGREGRWTLRSNFEK